MWHGLCFTCQKRPMHTPKETYSRDLHVAKETNVCMKRDLWKTKTWRGRSSCARCDMVCASFVKRDQCMHRKRPIRETFMCQKRPMYVWKETWERDLKIHAMWHGVCFLCQKRPMHFFKRDLRSRPVKRTCMCQKRPMYASKETYSRDLHVTKETHECTRRDL